MRRLVHLLAGVLGLIVFLFVGALIGTALLVLLAVLSGVMLFMWLLSAVLGRKRQPRRSRRVIDVEAHEVK